ncbi:MAG TPA: phage tail protein [Sphingobium sp.]|uniref:phage tail protein n=1 Tax=Sphingobium sp. TaxID=1912891 RepID=UPI002ED61532
MRKPDSLKSLLIATVPGLAKNPETLTLFIDNGRIVGGNGRRLSFEYHYRLNAVIEAYAGDNDALMVPVLAWIAENQSELLGKPGAQPFSFEAEILDAESRDVSIFIELTEAVIVTPKDGGGFNVTHPVQPPPASLDRFDGVPRDALLWQLFLRDDLVAQTTNPDFHP